MRQKLDERGAWANILPLPNRSDSPAFCAFPCKNRNLVEDTFNKLKQFASRRTQYEKLDATTSLSPNSLQPRFRMNSTRL
ncbi:hypothetical protein ETR14_14450 [Sphingosinicella sp. BN140058]|nr:hypothetical protein ETR14_14450 [Sphingosinicella sp. BN140058]